MEKEVCHTCGDIGYEAELVNCLKCLDSIIHKYCMLLMPEKNESVLWLCDECEEAESLKKSRKRAHLVLDSDDEDIPIKVVNKNRTSRNKISRTKLKKNTTRRDHHIPIKEQKKNHSQDHKGLEPEQHEIKHEVKRLYSSTRSAEPLIRSLWTGSFDIWNENKSICTRMGGFTAYISSKACQSVCNEAALFLPVLELKSVPKSLVWPKQFEGSGPADGNIGLYFFPSLMIHEQVYNYLVYEMIRDDLAMRAVVQNAELLIFTSVELPLRFRSFQGKLYLWGVFRERRA